MYNSTGIPMTVVCGPNGSGKTTYVRRSAGHSDLIIDGDAIGAALTSKPDRHGPPPCIIPYAIDAMNAVVMRVRYPEKMPAGDALIWPHPPHIWMMLKAPSAAERDRVARQYGASIIVLAVNADECLRRIELDPSRDPSAPYRQMIEAWWTEYEPRQGDTVIGSTHG